MFALCVKEKFRHIITAKNRKVEDLDSNTVAKYLIYLKKVGTQTDTLKRYGKHAEALSENAL